MSMSYGENLRVTIFGQSHSSGIGVVIDGIPAGETVDYDALQAFLDRRAPGRNALTTARREADVPEFLGGFVGNTTCGAPVAAILRNGDVRSGDYEKTAGIPRPGHADYTAYVKFFGHEDRAGGGHFSGRLTAPLALAGGIALQLLAKENIQVFARIASIGNVADEGKLTSSVSEKPFPTVSDEAGERMQELISRVKAEGDSVGGVVECAVTGVPAGLGDPMFSGMENRIASAVFAIPGVKGIEFGEGFGASLLRGSENNDPYRVRNGKAEAVSNHAGGILGGITNGEPLRFRAAFKPTPSIAKPQESVDLTAMTDTVLNIQGRHDPCIVVRAVPVVEAAAALAVYDAFLGRKKEL